MEHTYAQALWNAIQKGTKPREALAALRSILAAHGREILWPRIARAFERIALRESRRSEMTLSIAHEKDERSARKEAKEHIADLDITPDDLSVRIDSTLIGGWRLEGRERLVDASFKKYLLDMYNRTTR